MSIFNSLRHLLPRGRAWSITKDKQLRQLIEGLAESGDDAREFVDAVWSDLLPQTTRELDAWEQQFGLRSLDLTEQERRDRLDATWKAVGGQSPRYIQDTLRGAGFDVYVHDWWEPGSEPAVGVDGQATPRNPLLWLERGDPTVFSLVECGSPNAECGEVFAEAGNRNTPPGYALVNKILQTRPNFLVLCGEAEAECGEGFAAAGNYSGFIEQPVQYIVPANPDSWPFFFYIGGEEFGTTAQIAAERRDEFENLCLQICPLQLWIGLIVEYV